MSKVLLESYNNDSKLSMYINFTDFIIEDKFVLSNKSFKEISLDIRNDSEDPVINEDYIFDRTDIRAIFITLYTLVFCCCFFGNLLVILVVTLSRRLRSITNFFLANLAVADLCVGVFCVFQNLSIYLISSWVLGDFLCKMYQFVHSLSYTASIFILVVICTERYFAIIHPITCKQILTSTRLRLVIAAVWVTSALYSAPKFIWVQTITVNITNSEPETICIPHRKKYDSELFDMINFLLLYVLPLLVMTILYTRIAVGLWRSSRQLERQFNAGVGNGQTSSPFGTTNLQNTSQANDPLHHPPSVQKYDKPNANLADTQVSVNDDGLPATSCAWRTRPGTSIQTQIPSLNTHPQIHHINSAPQSTSSQNVLRARRGVIRMLIVVVLTFALCNLPYHARKMWQYWSDDYRGNSNFSTLFTPLTFLVTYFNSGVNPLLYAFLSRNFRKGMRELLLCSFRNVKKNKTKQRFLGETRNQQPLSHSSILRIGSTRSMAKANHTCTTIIR